MLSCDLLAQSRYFYAANASADTTAKRALTSTPNINHHNKTQLNSNYVKDLFLFFCFGSVSTVTSASKPRIQSMSLPAASLEEQQSHPHTCAYTLIYLQSHRADQVCLESSIERPVFLIRLCVHHSPKNPSL